MPIWNIKTTYRRNLLGIFITIPTVITILPTLGTVCTRLKPDIDAIFACIATIQAQLRSQLRESSTSILTSSIWGLTAACSQILMSKALDLTSPTLKLLKLVKLPYPNDHHLLVSRLALTQSLIRSRPLSGLLI